MHFVNPHRVMAASLPLCVAYRRRVYPEKLLHEAGEAEALTSQVALHPRSAMMQPEIGTFRLTRNTFTTQASTDERPGVLNSLISLQIGNVIRGGFDMNPDGQNAFCAHRTVRWKQAIVSFSIFAAVCLAFALSCIKFSSNDSASSMSLAFRCLLTLAVAANILVVIKLSTNAFKQSLAVREVLLQDVTGAALLTFMLYAEWKKGFQSAHANKAFAARVDVFSMLLVLTTVSLFSIGLIWQGFIRLRRFSNSRLSDSRNDGCPLLVSSFMSIFVDSIALLLCHYWRGQSRPLVHPSRDEAQQGAFVAGSDTSTRLPRTLSTPSTPETFSGQQTASPDGSDTETLTQEMPPQHSTPTLDVSHQHISAPFPALSESDATSESDTTILPPPRSHRFSRRSTRLTRSESDDSVSSESCLSGGPSDTNVTSADTNAVVGMATYVEEDINLNLRAAIFNLANNFVQNIFIFVAGVLSVSGRYEVRVDLVCAITLGFCSTGAACLILPDLLQKMSALRQVT
eukprot:TRINITY_DN66496_c0_g1_i1.p1 TRINITY_DN66496_c0_g1~~TRINITY_DN66496_c0_g1_i1.p1  ORF type:complete len:514 (-),score=38.20 TRINITY_DN66496_c0_g1_i1:15-1556(-)